MPFVDIAYQGFGRGLDEDAAGLRGMLDGLRRSRSSRRAATRISASIATASARCSSRPARREATATAMGHVFQLAREMWSMPPDHGAAAVRIILDDPELRADWLVELDAMRDRINSVRQRHRRRRPAPGLHRPASSACSRCCR